MNTVVIGSTGYGGVELIRLLENHPEARIGALVSSSQPREPLRAVYPHLSHMEETLEELDPDRLCEAGEVIFFATPPGVSSRWAPRFAERGKVCIDLSGDFRLTGEAYRRWYGREPAPGDWLERAVYGLSEWYAEQIRSASLISNPGCYPTASLLALIPLLRERAIDPDTIVIDAKSGVSGAGRGLKLNTLFCEVNENLRPYRVDAHQHTPEIERYASEAWGSPVRVTFIPHLVPMNRGILITLTARAAEGWTRRRLEEMTAGFIRRLPLSRIRPENDWPGTKQVQGSNYCDLAVHLDERTGRVIVMSVIDNLVKGAAGQAVQNLNLRMGWDETAGLEGLPLYP